MKRVKVFLTLLVAVFSIHLSGAELLYESGLLRDFDAALPKGSPQREIRRGEKEAVRAFVEKEFPRGDFDWKAGTRFADKTHVHQTHQLQYRGVRVLDTFLKTHFNRKGYMEYASSGWEFLFALDDRQKESRLTINDAKEKLAQVLSSIHGRFTGDMKGEPVVWIDKKEKRALWAYVFNVGWAGRGIYKRYVVDAKFGEVLEERSLVRHIDIPNIKAYNISPLANGGAFDTVTLRGLSVNTALISPEFRVRRDEPNNKVIDSATDADPVDVVPDDDYGGAVAFQSDPDNYSRPDICGGGVECACVTTPCPNQSLEAVNVYYHLSEYRQTIDAYLSDLGLSSDLSSVLSDPLEVIVNGMSVDFSGEGDTFDESNNAGYISAGCRATSLGAPTIDRCLVFLRPSAGTTDACGTVGTYQFYHVAREALVVVHEYEHYITDRVTEMIPGTYANPNVGDALHEGYSDYFAASQVSDLAGTDVTAVGAYAFQDCTPIIRDISILTEYENTTDGAEPHRAGHSWASGLWKLRTTVGMAVADKIALKSLFFISPTPSFIEAVESLVRADEALNAGANAATIRTIFYDQVKFLGGMDGVFRDPASGVVEMGLRSCASTRTRPGDPRWSFVLFSLWVLTTLLLGRLGRAK